MSNRKFRAYFAICVTFGVAMILAIMPMPRDFFWLRPHWMTLILIYWVMFLPNFVGVISAFVVGLFLDLLHGTVLGSTALVLAIIVFLAAMIQPRIKQFKFWQQLTVVMVLLALEQLIYLWLQLFLGRATITEGYWWATCSSVVAWFLLLPLLQAYQKKLNLL